MAKPTSLSIPIGPGLHVVRLSGRGFGQTLVRTAHTAVSGFGKVNGGAATITNLGILPQKTSLCRQRVDYSNLVNLACIILVTSLLCVCFISCCKMVALHLSHLSLHNTPINRLPEPHNFPRFIVNKLMWKCSQFVFVFSFIGPAWFGSKFRRVFIPDDLFILAGTSLVVPLGFIQSRVGTLS